MRIVLDTAAFISGVRSRQGAANEVLRLVLEGRLTIVMDLKLSLEYENVALRIEHLQASGLPIEGMRTLVEAIQNSAEAVPAVQLLRPLSSDPNDDMILELAVSAGVQAIVTSNKRHFVQAAQTFGILVLTPGELVARLKGPRHDF